MHGSIRADFDRRYRSRMSVSFRSVDSLVCEWARWSRGEVEKLGIPCESILSRLMRCGFTGAAQPGPTPEMPDRVFRVEMAILRLMKIERTVLAKYYLTYQPVECSARQCHMSVYRFRKLLKRAMERLASELLDSKINFLYS